jgi:uncharacterized delta-60 repeat protein
MAVQSNGMLVTAGGQGSTGIGQQAFALARFTTTGSLDPSFGGDGIVTTAFGGGAEAEGVVIDGSGLIVAAGAAGNGLGLARYKPSGALDGSFGTGGTLVQKIGYTGEQSFGLSIGVDPKGRYVVGAGATPKADSDYEFAAARFLSS